MAVQLRALDLHTGGPRIETDLESVLPGVRGDHNQLMQVFFNIVNNGLDAMGDGSGGVMTIKTLREPRKRGDSFFGYRAWDKGATSRV